MIRYGSVCSGIEAASVAWHVLGWKPAWFAEIEPFPSAVLSHRWPDVPNFGDFTRIARGGQVAAAIDLLVGGTPCQSFSVAGLRGGLDDARGELALEFLRLARRTGARWLLWENVPGALSSNGGRDFGSILGGLVELGYGFAYRILDAQFFGVPQRRRRVFVVAHLGDWERPSKVLFESEGVRRNPAAPASEGPHGEIPQTDRDARDGNAARGEWWDGRGVSQTLDAVLYKKQALPEKNRFPAVAVPAWIPCPDCDDFFCQFHGQHVADCECPAIDDWAALDLSPYDPSLLRWITPVEAERLQGFPDNYTLIDGASDGPRFKAVGNSMAVPVMRWIGERIAAVEGDK